MKMKLLQWVHHRFQHTTIQPLKDLSIGNACICLSAQPSVDDQDSCMKPSLGSIYGCTSLEPPKRDRENTFSESEAMEQEDKSAIISDLFHGFLTIGTLGSEPSINEPSTPTFAMTLANLTEEKGEVTENDLKLISYELEKFLKTETKEEGVRASSARNSHVSIITLGDKQMEESEDDEYWTAEICPLKGYLFKAAIDLPEMGIEKKKEKASLQELFDKTKMTTGNCKEKSETEEIKTNNKHNSAMQFMKKMMKKFHASSKSSAPSIGGDAADPVSIMKKLGEASDPVALKKKPHKILRIFHRKIHPENSIAAKGLSKSKKYKDNNSDAGGGGNDKRRFPQGARVTEGTENCKKCLNLPQYWLSGTNFSRNGEHWIKTDANYLVLEL